MTNPVKVMVNLNPKTYLRILELSARAGIEKVNALNFLVLVGYEIIQEIRSGNEVHLVSKNGHTRRFTVDKKYKK